MTVLESSTANNALQHIASFKKRLTNTDFLHTKMQY